MSMHLTVAAALRKSGIASAAVLTVAAAGNAQRPIPVQAEGAAGPLQQSLDSVMRAKRGERAPSLVLSATTRGFSYIPPARPELQKERS